MNLTKFTPQEIAEIAERQRCSLEELRRRWIIQHGKSYYVIGPEGTYQKPILRTELMVSLPRDLIRVPTTEPYGIDMYKQRDDKTVKKNVDELLVDYCTNAREAIADMSLDISWYDPREQTMHEAVCPIKPVMPMYHEKIAEWLRLFGGEQHEKLLDWIATLTRTDLPTCALLVTGKPGAGKEVLAQGLARRWRKVMAATELARVLEGFNEDLARCPLVFCDENMPATKGGKKGALADIKSMVATSQRTLARKFLSNADLLGAIRLILAENGNQMLFNNSDETDNEREATAIRFLHVKVDEKPADYLRFIGGRKTTEAWVAGGQLAEHAAWLEQTRTVVPGPRFIVEGDASDIQRQLIISNKHISLVIEWIVKHIATVPSNDAQVVAANGIVLINATTIYTRWSQYIQSDFVPSTTRIGLSLRSLSLQEVRHTWTVGEKLIQHRYHSIKTDLLYEWSKQNQVGDPEALKATVDRTWDLEKAKNDPSPTGSGSGGSTTSTYTAPKDAGSSLFDVAYSQKLTSSSSSPLNA